MKAKKLFLSTLCVFTLVSPTVVSAQSISADVSVQATFPGIQLYGNETGYKFMVINRKLYKRLWSYTYCRWEDDAWTPV